jgi:hypothetical protein
MENDEIFKTKTTLESDKTHQRGSDHINGNSTGVQAMMAGNSGYDKHLTSVTTEESPLLPDRSSSDGASGEEDEDAATNIPGTTDFEGMPWWKTPSVGLPVPTGPQHVLTLPYRYSGCCLLI